MSTAIMRFAIAGGTTVKKHETNEHLSDFHLRLRKLVGDESQNSFATRAHISQSAFNRIWHGGSPSLDSLIAIANAGGVPVGWLAAGEKGEGKNETLVRKLAFRASAGGGAVVLQDEPTLLPLPTSLIDELGLRAENARAMEAAGDSMAPTIKDGDLVLINTADRELREGKAYVFTIGDEAFLKRLRRERGRLVRFSDNPDFPPEPIPPEEDFRIVGRVVWGGRRL